LTIREFGNELLTSLLEFTLESVPGCVGVGLSLATEHREDGGTPRSIAAIGLAGPIDIAQWTHARGPIWDAFRRDTLVARPGSDSVPTGVLADQPRADQSRGDQSRGDQSRGDQSRGDQTEGDRAGTEQAGGEQTGMTPAASTASGSAPTDLGLDDLPGIGSELAGIRGAVFVPGEFGAELPTVFSVYLDRVPDERALRAIDRYEPLAVQALAVVEYCAGEEEIAQQMLQMTQYRRVIEQAKGLVMGALGTDAPAAFSALARASQHFNIRLRNLAVALVEHVGGHSAEHPQDPDLVIRPSAAERETAARIWAALTTSSILGQR